jgi:HEAT repeat protein
MHGFTRKRIAVGAAALLALLLATLWFFPAEPSYEGKKVSVWLRDLRETQLGATNREVAALVEIGPACLPYLTRQLKLKDSSQEDLYRRLWKKAPASFRKHLPLGPTRMERRAAAAFALKQIGPAAAIATPELVNALNDPSPQVRRLAAEALRDTEARGPASLNALRRALKDPDSMVRGRAEEALWQMGPQAEPAIPDLAELLKDPGHAYMGALCLGAIGPPARLTVPSLVEVLKQGAVGDPSQVHFQNTTGNLFHLQNHNRAMAAEALGKIGIATQPVIRALANAAQTCDESRQAETAAEALGKLNAYPELAIPALENALANTNTLVAMTACKALAAFGPAAAHAIPLLTDIMHQPPRRPNYASDICLPVVAADALCQINPENRPLALPVLMNGLGNCYQAYTALLAQTNIPRTYQPQLREKLKNAKDYTAVFTAHILYTIDPNDPEPLRVINEILTQTTNSARACAAFTLWKMTGDANLSLSVLTALLQERIDSPATQAYPQYLAEMGEAAKPALPALRQALWHRHIYTRSQAGKALRRLDPQP